MKTSVLMMNFNTLRRQRGTLLILSTEMWAGLGTRTSQLSTRESARLLRLRLEDRSFNWCKRKICLNNHMALLTTFIYKKKLAIKAPPSF